MLVLRVTLVIPSRPIAIQLRRLMENLLPTLR